MRIEMKYYNVLAFSLILTVLRSAIDTLDHGVTDVHSAKSCRLAG